MARDTLLTGSLVRIPWVGPRAVYRLQQGGIGYGVEDWPALVRTAKLRLPEAVSVDVFDTCIVRDLVGDAAVEHLIDHRRDQTEPAAGVDGAGAGDGSETAATVERELCRPVPGVAPALAAIRGFGIQIVFLSDTDRSSALLVDILRSHGIFVDGDRLVASCETGSTKSDGGLFGHTFGDLRSNGDGPVWHIGNHPWADVAMAAAGGLEPMPVTRADANRYELAMSVRPTSFGPAVAGAARNARLSIEQARRSGAIDDHSARVRALGADVAGQAMAAFVLWVAEQSRSQGIEHLAFLARDGELPLEVARALPADHWDGRSLRYLHCSRLTWSLAAASVLGVERWLREGTTDDDAFLHAKRHDVPFQALLARIGLTTRDLAGEQNHQRLTTLEQGQVLPLEAVEDWEAVLADPAVRQQIADRADHRLKLIVDRLRAEGMPAGKFGLVDVGWRGRLASQVSAVLTQVVGQEPVHFHFGGKDILLDVDAYVPIRRFAFDGISDPHPIDEPVSCIETLTASGKPRVIEYRRNAEGEVELVFDQPPGGNDGDRGELWAGALRTAELIPDRATFDRWGLEPDALVAETIAVLDHWWNRPTADEVEALSDLTFEHDEAGTALRPLVTPYRLSELNRNRAPSIRRHWPQGSAAASGPLMSNIARLVRSSRVLRRRLGG